MQDILEKAQAAANELQTKIYVFRAVGLNGHESVWFNSNGRKNSPHDELVNELVPDPSR